MARPLQSIRIAALQGRQLGEAALAAGYIERVKEPESVGPYRLQQCLGSGGMGRVYSAYDERLGRLVALKHIHPERASDPKAKARFLREARHAAKLNHPSLVPVHDILENEQGYWIVMELVRGDRLDQVLKDGPLSLERGLPLVQGITDGLAAIHAAGMVHRDLKTENVMISSERNSRARILDFGLSKTDDQESSLPGSAGVVGTPRAMSPEQAQNQKLSPLSDLFSLGVLLYEVFAGDSPFLGPSPLETLARVCHHDPEPMLDRVADLPEELSRLVERLLSKDPFERPQSAVEVAANLRHLLVPTPGSPTSSDRPLLTPSRSAGSQPIALESLGERRVITVLCCELVEENTSWGGSSTSLDPETLSEVLVPFQTLVSHLIRRYEGHLADFQGHRVIIYFGYPQAEEDDAERAVRCALRLTERVQDLSSTFHGELRLRAGLHSGPAIIWMNSGQKEGPAEPRPAERLILGNTLDIASDLQENAAPGRILASQVTHQLIDGLFFTESPEECKAPPRESSDQGESAGRPYRQVVIKGVVGERRILERIPTPKHLVARDRELALMQDRFELASEGEGQVVLIQGPGGIGKTRLVQAAFERLGTSAPPPARPDFVQRHIQRLLPGKPSAASRWLAIEGHRFSRHQSLHPVPSLIRQLFAGQLPADTDGSLEPIRAALQSRDLPTDEFADLLGTLLHAAPEPAELADLPTQQRTAIAELIPELILEFATPQSDSPNLRRHATLVLVVENLQWLDADTLDIIFRLIEQAPSAPIFLILTARPTFKPPWGYGFHLAQLQLPPLDFDQSEALLRNDSATKGAPAKTLRQIIGKAGGLPFYLEELARDLPFPPPHKARGRSHLSVRLQANLTAKLDRLGSAKALLQVASTFDRDFSRQELIALWPFDDLEPELDGLIAAEALLPIDSASSSFRLGSPLLRQAARDSLLDEDRETLMKRAKDL